MSMELVESLRLSAQSIRNDATPSQVGPSAELLEEAACVVEAMEAALVDAVKIGDIIELGRSIHNGEAGNQKLTGVAWDTLRNVVKRADAVLAKARSQGMSDTAA